jgi:CheY-like chemotaxis protein
MPVLTGNEVFAQMQLDPRLATVPVIVSTSDPSRAPSGVLIMKKPIDLDRLLGAIRQHCGVGC